MIADIIENSGRYLNVHRGLSEAFEFIKKSKTEHLPAGHYIIDGENSFANIEEYETYAPALLKYEMHEEYIDVHYILEGEELLGYNAGEADLQENGATADFISVRAGRKTLLDYITMCL